MGVGNEGRHVATFDQHYRTLNDSSEPGYSSVGYFIMAETRKRRQPPPQLVPIVWGTFRSHTPAARYIKLAKENGQSNALQDMSMK